MKDDPRNCVSDEALQNCIEWNVKKAHETKDARDSARLQANAIEVANYLRKRQQNNKQPIDNATVLTDSGVVADLGASHERH